MEIHVCIDGDVLARITSKCLYHEPVARFTSDSQSQCKNAESMRSHCAAPQAGRLAESTPARFRTVSRPHSSNRAGPPGRVERLAGTGLTPAWARHRPVSPLCRRAREGCRRGPIFLIQLLHAVFRRARAREMARRASPFRLRSSPAANRRPEARMRDGGQAPSPRGSRRCGRCARIRACKMRAGSRRAAAVPASSASEPARAGGPFRHARPRRPAREPPHERCAAPWRKRARRAESPVRALAEGPDRSEPAYLRSPSSCGGGARRKSPLKQSISWVKIYGHEPARSESRCPSTARRKSPAKQSASWMKR